MGHGVMGLLRATSRIARRKPVSRPQSCHATSALIITTYRLIGGQSNGTTRRECAQGTRVCLDAGSGQQVA